MKTSSLDSIIGPGSEGPETQKAALSQRRLATAIPWLLLVGFLCLAWILFGDRLERSIPVQVESVVTLKRTVDQPVNGQVSEGNPTSDPWEAGMLFQASGWIEPDPLPIKATALVNGVVECVGVLEGEVVKQGQILAELISEDFELDLETAESDLTSLQAQAEAHESAIKAGAARIVTLDKKVEAGGKRCLELEDRLRRLERARAGAISEEALTLAKLQLETHESEVDALKISRVELESDLESLEATRKEFEAQILRAEVEVKRRRLALERTNIISPIDGVVLRLLAVPGQKRMLDMDDPDSATVAILYQPGELQARIDVPLEEAAQLNVGQAVRLRSNFLPDRVFKSTVTRIVGEADLQRNTLQAKVRVEDPDHRLRPDMLCRAEFLASGVEPVGSSNEDAAWESGRISIFVPEASLINRSGTEAELWAIDDSGARIEKRTVVLSNKSKDGFVLATGDIRPGDRVIIGPPDELEVGSKVKPIAKGGNDE